MSEGRRHFYGRVVPDAEDQRLLDSGWYDTHRAPWWAPSGSWWRKGALVVDEQGPGLIDADGIRHSLPVPPWGGKLVYAHQAGMVSAKAVSVPFVFVADENDHPLFLLPEDGFSKEIFRGFAEAAGLAFVVPPISDSSELQRRYPGYDSRPKPYWALRRNRADRERSLTARVRRLLGRKPPEV